METVLSIKHCKKCGRDKPTVDFYPHPKTRISHKCKDCTKRDMQAHRHRLSPEERRTRDQRFMAAIRSDPERLARHRAYHVAYRAEHKDRIAAYHAKLRAERGQEINAKIAAWRKTPLGRESARRKHVRRQAAMAGARLLGSHTYAEWVVCKAEHDFRCAGCYQQEPAIILTRDHVVPLSHGGTDDISNIQPLCRRCNSVKRNTLDKYDAFGHINAGKLELDSPRAVASALLSFRDGPVVITITPKRATRSLSQLAYYWGVVIEHLSEHTGYTPDEIHEFLKAKFIPKRVAICDGNGEIRDDLVIGGSTSKMDKGTFSEYIEAIRGWAAQDLGVVIPDPQ